MSKELNSKVPAGPVKDMWKSYKDHVGLVNPANRRNIDIIVVGTGLAGGSASASLALWLVFCGSTANQPRSTWAIPVPRL